MAVFKYNYHNLNKTEGTVISYDVQIKSDTGDIITVTVPGNPTDKSREEITQAALEQFYQETFPQRAENEKFAKMDKLIKEATETLDTTRKALASNGMVAFENQSELEDVQAKLEFLAKHLNIKYPTDEDEEVTEVTNNEEATNGESTDV